MWGIFQCLSRGEPYSLVRGTLGGLAGKTRHDAAQAAAVACCGDLAEEIDLCEIDNFICRLLRKLL